MSTGSCRRPRRGRFINFSPLARIFPYLEQNVLFSAFNFDVGLRSSGNSPVRPENLTATQAVVAAFLCPSDPNSGKVLDSQYRPANYVGCAGTGTVDDGNFLTPYADGVIFVSAVVSFAAVQDGLSNTAMFSESLIGNGVDAPSPVGIDRRRQYIHLGNEQPPKTRPSEERCGLSSPFPVRGDRNYAWAIGRMDTSLYNHYRLPNDPLPDCYHTHVRGWKAARAEHPGGAHVGLCDGSVRFVKDSIALPAWRALATRAGGEVVSSEAY